MKFIYDSSLRYFQQLEFLPCKASKTSAMKYNISYTRDTKINCCRWVVNSLKHWIRQHKGWLSAGTNFYVYNSATINLVTKSHLNITKIFIHFKWFYFKTMNIVLCYSDAHWVLTWFLLSNFNLFVICLITFKGNSAITCNIINFFCSQSSFTCKFYRNKDKDRG